MARTRKTDSQKTIKKTSKVVSSSKIRGNLQGKHDYYALFKSLSDSFFLLDEKGNIKYASNSKDKSFSFELLNSQIISLFPGYFRRKIRALLTNSISTGKTNSTEIELNDDASNPEFYRIIFSKLPLPEEFCIIAILIDKSFNVAQSKLKNLWADAFSLCSHGMAIGIPGINKIMTCNQAFAELQGRTIPEIESMPILSMYDPAEQNRVMNFIQKADRDGKSRYESRMVRKDGSIYPVQMDITSVRDSSGNIIYRIVTQQDITERKENEAILVHASERFNQIAEQSQTVIWEVDHTGLYTYLSPMTKSVWGYEPDELVRKKHYYDIHPETGREEFKEATLRFFNERKSFFNLPNPIVHSSGEIIWMSTNGIPVIDSDNNLIGYRGADNDITDLKKSEESLRESLIRFHHLADNGQALIWTSGLDKKCDYFNKVWLDFTGRSLEQELGDGWADGVHPDDLERCIDIYFSAFDKKEEFSMDYRLRYKDGSYRWIHDAGKPRYDDKGEFLGYIGHCLDITQRIEQEKIISEKESDYRSLFEGNPMAMFIFDKESYKILDINAACISLYGYSREEFLTLTIADIRPAEDMSVMKKWLNVTENQLGTVSEVRHLKKNGEIFWVDLLYHDLSYKGKNARHVSVNDITFKIESEKAIKETEEKFRSTLDTMIEGCQIIGFDWKYIFINKAGEIQNRKPNSEMIGKTVTQVWPGVTETRLYQLMKRCIEQRIPGYFETDFEFPDGSAGWYEVSLQPVKEGIFMQSVDITSKKNSDKAYKENSDRLRILVDEATEGIFLHDAKGRFREINSYACKILGYSREELLNMNVLDISNNTDESGTSERWSKVVPGVSQTFYSEHKRKDGTIFPVEIRLGVIEIENERLYLALTRDISQRVEAEEEMKKLVNRLNLAASSAGIGIWDWDIRKNVIHWDEKMFQLYGKPNTGLSTYEIWLNSIHPEDKERSQEASEKAVRGESEYNTEFRIIWSDKSVHWLKANGKVFFDKKGEPERMIGVNFDFTDRVKAEEDLKASERIYKYLFENNPQPMWIYDLDSLAFLEVNSSAVHKYGYRREEFLNMTLRDIRPPEDLDKLQKNIEAHVPSYTTSGPWRHKKKNGEIIYVEIISHFIVYQGYKARLVLANDITAKKIAEDELIKLNESLEQIISERTAELEEANRAKSEFLANMSHEIRTPMNAILGYSELLRSLVSNETQRDYLNSIRSSGKTLLTLINDILDLSKIEAGKLELDYGYIHTYSFFPEFEKIFAFKLKEKGLEFITNIHDGIPAFIYIDETRLRQVLLNLIGNAVKFTHSGKITLEVSWGNINSGPGDSGNDKKCFDLQIRVHDTGIGIAPEFHKSIFSSFFQVRGKESKGGTGLGLAISSRLVNLMNGSLSFESEQGKGTVFTIDIPYVEFTDSYRENGKTTEINTENITFGESTILVVDDIDENRKYIYDALKETRIKVLEASDGLDAITRLEKIRPDLIISDIMMPEMDGFGLLAEIKADPELAGIPVVAFTALAMKEQMDKIRNADFAGILTKPVQLSDLYQVLSEWLPYTVKESTADESLGKNLKDIVNPEGLLDEMNGVFQERNIALRQRQPINDVKAFGNDILELGKKYNSEMIIQYGEKVMRASESFNVQEILKLIGQYDSLKEIIQEFLKSK